MRAPSPALPRNGGGRASCARPLGGRGLAWWEKWLGRRFPCGTPLRTRRRRYYCGIQSRHEMTSEHADRPRILIVDDEKFIRDILADFLGMEGYVVRTAEDGTAALREIRARALRHDHQRPQDAAHGGHRAARRPSAPRRPGRAHGHHDRLRHRRDRHRRDEAGRVRLRPQAVQGRRGHPRRPARDREAAHGRREPAAARGPLALQGQRGHRGEPVARRGPGDGRRRRAARDSTATWSPPGSTTARGRFFERQRLVRAEARRPTTSRSLGLGDFAATAFVEHFAADSALLEQGGKGHALLRARPGPAAVRRSSRCRSGCSSGSSASSAWPASRRASASTRGSASCSQHRRLARRRRHRERAPLRGPARHLPADHRGPRQGHRQDGPLHRRPLRSGRALRHATSPSALRPPARTSSRSSGRARSCTTSARSAA